MSARPITATYRLQLRGPEADPQGAGRAFTFAEAAETVPYLAQLGISHLYLSPVLTAPPESNHNYDVTDPTEVNPELGGIEGLRQLADAAHELGLGLIMDIVPNHVGIDDPEDNAWWWDVLTYGRDSDYEYYFDIDWHEDNGAGGKLGLPILGAPGDEDKLELREHDGQPVLTYYDNVFPVRPGTSTSLEDDPQEVYDRQCYRLMFWRDGVISYRRFFSVNGLAGIRQEDPRVFEHSHRILRQLIAEDLIDGIRVDHPDGLSDPFEYLSLLRDLIGPDRWLIIEKILGVEEPLDPRLAVDGTTGYDALRELDGVFVNRDAEDHLSMLALQQSGSTWDESAVTAAEQELKREVARHELAAEVRRLARALRRDNFSTAGSSVSEEQLTTTIVELVAAMPVYRADYLSLSRMVAALVAEMSRRFPSRRDALDLFAAGLLADSEAKVRFAQVCGAVMAKGVEDTTFYRASRLIALQEVGGAPGRFGVSVAEFHLLQQERARLWPRTMTTLSTHDAKRGEDVRARILELTEVPDEFAEFVRRLTAVIPAPDEGTGHFLLQNLLGVWPVDGVVPESLKERFHAYTEKSIREAGVHTNWFDPDTAFEKAVGDWVDALFDGPVSNLITTFVAPLHRGAVQISLGRKLLQLIGAGIPDTYQGTEFFTDSLVDPDNRRFVDYTAREQSLAVVQSGLDWVELAKQAADTVAQGDTGVGDLPAVALDAATPYPHLWTHADRAKQMLIHTALQLRRAHPELFTSGDHQAVFAEGPAEAHLVGLARGLEPGADGLEVIAVATRSPLVLQREGGWRGTTLTLPAGTWREELSGRTFTGMVPVAEVLRVLPTALLRKLPEESGE
ncbi:malto-oligosyltrehalose synthase [Corynebacterium halotolerans]|uniref:malto-oligosyltrehalose synthase n=1 Tax=Corynebacterium halotolerans TaxID=225326 RepID=UPI003CEB99CF